MYVSVFLLLFLFRVFSIVAESVGKHLSPKSSSVVSWPFLNNALMTIINTLLKCIDVTFDENIIEAGKITNKIIIFKCINSKYFFS